MMRLEDFISMCERKAIKFFSVEGASLTESEFDEKAEELASELAMKREDFSYYYDIAIPAITNVFRNPSRFARMVKSPADDKQEKKLLSFIGAAAD